MISIENRFVNNDELKDLISKARCVLFSYNSDSVLSSGALMDTIGMGGFVIGPYKGAFKDLSKSGRVSTYKNYNQLICLLDRVVVEIGTQEVYSDSYDILTWESFSEKFFLSLNV
ncbi:MAG: hypothetical protein HC830_00620 [Bacteroidetes bacterium]|nr:hypothetical protein [Bacteroidota bacterium]